MKCVEHDVFDEYRYFEPASEWNIVEFKGKRIALTVCEDLWNLGNENNYSFDGRLNPWSSPEIDALKSFAEQKDARAKLYYSFVNDVAKMIKEIDPNHPTTTTLTLSIST